MVELKEGYRMEQEIQPTIQQPVEKKSRWGLWLIAILILIAIGIGAYFLLAGDSSAFAGVGSSIPQPPALPSG